MSKKAIIAGSTGLVGSHLLDILLEKGDYERIVTFVRRPSGMSHPVLRERLVAFKDLDSMEFNNEVDDIYCCLGTTMKKAGSKKKFIQVDFDYPLKLAEIGLQHGAKRMFIVSSMGANRRSMFFYSRVKGKMEEAISKLPFKTIGIFRPALILGERKETRLGEEIAKKVTSIIDPILPKSMSKYKGVQARDIAKAMIEFSKLNKEGVHIIESDKIRKGIST
ncbi:NAD-dependent epimerase/dehydratase family protein [Hyphobacterium sp. CCMP332]|nr:NAD-dependent epimerase/dehydratase family protein [Hyphobacterium sp. CCMP332]